jgi:hypothetical protein
MRGIIKVLVLQQKYGDEFPLVFLILSTPRKMFSRKLMRSAAKNVNDFPLSSKAPIASTLGKATMIQGKWTSQLYSSSAA